MNKFLAFFALTFLLCAAHNPLKPITIVFYGDSITAGYGLERDLAFPAYVESGLREQGYEVNVINAGLSGETSAGGSSRISWVLRQPVDIFVLELGANDGLRGLPIEQTKNNLQQIIDQVKEKYPKTKIVLAGMQVPPNLGEGYTNAFKKIYPELATKNQALLIPFILEGIAGDEKLNQADGIHPNVEGHKKVAQNVIKALTKIL
ncbi:MAG: arylesterase [Cyclobacteriaceae bacterium]|nr:arylesterase [Cyclobacteriaceae bacterium]